MLDGCDSALSWIPFDRPAICVGLFTLFDQAK
jgi:hypothetical protein